MHKSLFSIPLLAILLSCGGQSYYDLDNDIDDDYYEDHTYEDLDDLYDTEIEEPSGINLPMEVNWEELISNDLSDGQIVNIEGYLGRLPTSMFNSDSREKTLDVFERRNQIEGNKMRMDVVIGTSPGHVRSLPEDYEQADLRVICDQDIVAGVGSHVRIQGKYSESSGGYYNYLDLEKIRILSDDFDVSTFDRAIKLTDRIVEDEGLDDVYSFMDVSLSISSYMSLYHDKYTVNVKQSDNKYTERAYFYVGESAGKMEELPKSYADKDFIIYDYLGNAHKGTIGKFRLYGTFNRLDVESKGVFTVEEIKKL